MYVWKLPDHFPLEEDDEEPLPEPDEDNDDPFPELELLLLPFFFFGAASAREVLATMMTRATAWTRK
jgi:hypothetical protein